MPGPMCLFSHTLVIMALCNTDSNGQKSNGIIAHSTSINRIRHQYIGNEGNHPDFKSVPPVAIRAR